MNGIRKDCIILGKCVYGLVKAAMQYNKKALEVMEMVGFMNRNVDPLFSMIKSTKVVVYTTL